MGSCYSKNTTGISLESKPPKQKLQDSIRNKKLSLKELSLGKTSFKANEKICEEAVVVSDSINSERSRSSTPEIEPRRFNEKHVNHGIAPSDSGIDSIDNVEVEVAQVAKEDYNHSSHLEQLSTETCHKCSNHILGKLSPNVHKISNKSSEEKKSEPFTDISPRQLSSSTKLCTKCNSEILTFSEKSTISVSDIVNGDHINMEESEFSLEKSNLTNKHISLERSVCMVSDVFSDENSINTAPLAEFDSIEANLNESPPHSIQKRQSLLSEILDITQSFCKCDFYSIEYCKRDHGNSSAVPEASNNILNSEIGTSEQSDKSIGHLNHFSTSSPCKNEFLSGSAANFIQKFGTPNKKVSSLPKNVSFVTHEEVRCESFTESEMATSNNPVLSSIATDDSIRKDHGCVVTKSSEEGCTNKTVSELILSNKRKDFHIRSASLGGVRSVMSDTSSDAPAGGTEDDMASLDLDSISRVTSLSYNSIRQLVESTEDLVSRQYTTHSVTIDGVDFVVIPTDSYRQMLSDIATLKQQLMNLSSLIQEIEDLEQN